MSDAGTDDTLVGEAEFVAGYEEDIELSRAALEAARADILKQLAELAARKAELAERETKVTAREITVSAREELLREKSPDPSIIAHESDVDQEERDSVDIEDMLEVDDNMEAPDAESSDEEDTKRLEVVERLRKKRSEAILAPPINPRKRDITEESRPSLLVTTEAPTTLSILQQKWNVGQGSSFLATRHTLPITKSTSTPLWRLL
ncbi:hypothetical protein DL93DRAFT_1000429 [Clavulina sp. PMI_390]|nr:hypothetical protein DL93DRAFT_1000429 [Clavulina sp. PMI_390]